MNNKLSIIIDDKRWNNCGFDISQVSGSVFDKVIKTTKKEIVFLDSKKNIEANLSLNNDAEIQKLNKEFRMKDAPTNVLSFANIDDDDFYNFIDNSPIIELGDIIISYETTSKEAMEKQIPLYDHFVHLLIHGILHLLGFDHIDDSDAEEMEALEVNILQQLNINNPY